MAVTNWGKASFRGGNAIGKQANNVTFLTKSKIEVGLVRFLFLTETVDLPPSGGAVVEGEEASVHQLAYSSVIS